MAGKKKVNKKKKKASWSSFFLILIVFVGAGFILYPSVSDWWNDLHTSQAIASYVEQVKSLDADRKAIMLEEARAYNAKLNTGVHFISQERHPKEYEEYLTKLDITGTGIMGYVQIPSIGVNLPIYHGTSDTVLQVAVGHLAGSSLPVGGTSTHAVLSGHRGLPSAKLFTDLDQLAEGDIFMVNVLDETVTYQVDQIHIVLPQEITDLAIQSGKDYMTLITCTPYGVNTHRMLVRGHRIDNLPEEVREILITSDAIKVSTMIVMLGITLLLILVALLISSLFSLLFGQKKSGEAVLKELKESMKTEVTKDDEE